jgi:hypothetical protein
MPQQPPTHSTSVELAIAQAALTALGAAFDLQGPYTPELTRAAATALTDLAWYLQVCMDAAQPVAIGDLDDLRDLLLSLNAATAKLHQGLTALLGTIDRRTLPVDPTELDITAVAEIRAALVRAGQGLRACVNGLADAHHATAGHLIPVTPPPGT